MSRPLRIEFPGAYYHVMNRDLAYQSIFKIDQDRETLCAIMRKRIERDQALRGSRGQVL